jgi:hypothetical protein
VRDSKNPNAGTLGSPARVHLHCYSWTGVGDDRCKEDEHYRAAEPYFLCSEDEAQIGLDLRLELT